LVGFRSDMMGLGFYVMRVGGLSGVVWAQGAGWGLGFSVM
jgi:hypothetical protein